MIEFKTSINKNSFVYGNPTVSLGYCIPTVTHSHLRLCPVRCSVRSYISYVCNWPNHREDCGRRDKRDRSQRGTVGRGSTVVLRSNNRFMSATWNLSNNPTLNSIKGYDWWFTVPACCDNAKFSLGFDGYHLYWEKHTLHFHRQIDKITTAEIVTPFTFLLQLAMMFLTFFAEFDDFEELWHCTTKNIPNKYIPLQDSVRGDARVAESAVAIPPIVDGRARQRMPVPRSRYGITIIVQ